MTGADLDAVMAIEEAAYAVPWTRGNFIDSLASGYLTGCLSGGRGETRGVLLGYFVAMQAADEMHLLNLTVAPARQGRGHGMHLLDALATLARRGSTQRLWLEVRESNVRARGLYRRYGLVEVGRRKAYYPVAPGGVGASAREDAVLMSLLLGGGP